MERLALLEVERQRWVSHHMVKGLLRIAQYQDPGNMDLIAEDEEIMKMLFPWKKIITTATSKGADLENPAILGWINQNAIG